jgi:fluoride exporter
MIKSILLVGLGGGVGSAARYLCQKWFAGHISAFFPWGTFVVNITGCFLIGLLWSILNRPVEPSNGFANVDWKLLLMTGVCGGYTTFSAFTLEGIVLIKDQKFGIFFFYTLASVALGLLATYAGIKLARL